MPNYKEEKLGAVVRKLETNFISGGGTLMSKYVTTDLYTDINTIYAYLESKHISGETDSLGREKPFFNIVLAARNIWFRATDIDRKDIILTPTKSEDTVAVFLLRVHLQNWMKKERFGTFLNTWGLELSGFNSAVVKFVEKEGKLILSVIPWSRLIVDQVNFASNPKIELLELTEAELYERGYDEKAIKDLCDSKKARELTDRQKKDNKNNYYKLYEVHGLFPLSYLTEKDKDKEIFTQQMHVMSFVSSKKKGEYDEFCLYKGKEEKDPYMLTSLFPATDGSISLNGSVKNLFDAQWMMNHTKKAIKDQLDLASKLIFQTADGNFVGQNALNAIETGDILIHGINMPLTQLQNNSHDVSALQSFGAEWKQLSSEINGISESMLGAAAPSGTAWRQVEALLQESHSLFEVMTENKGLHIEDMLRMYILPFLKKKMNNSKEISATLESYDLQNVDKKYIPYEADRRLAKKIIHHMITTGQTPDITEEMRTNEIADVKDELNGLGNKRFFKPDELDTKTWKETFKDIEEEVEIRVTNESTNTQEVLQTLNTALTVIANPNYANNPKAQFVVDKILTMTGHLSPMELSAIPEPTPIAPTISSPMAGQVGDMTLPVTK